MKIESKKKNSWLKIMPLIILAIIFLLFVYLYSFNQEELSKKRINTNLTTYNYEVVEINDISSIKSVVVEMKPSGDIEKQIWRGFIILSKEYPDYGDYTVKIVSSENNCYYPSKFTYYNSYLRALKGEEVYVNLNLGLEGFIFPKVLEDINKRYNQNIRIDYKSPIEASILYKIVIYQIREQIADRETSCENN